jgi:phage nucleotide-binding protein
MPARRTRVTVEPDGEVTINGLPVYHPENKEFIRFLVFAPGGYGKTRLVGTSQLDERMVPMLLLDYEGGSHVLKGIEPQIDVVDIQNWDDYWRIYDFLVSDQNHYRTVVVDSISETHFGALTEILDSTASKRTDPDRIDQSDYSKASTQIKRMIRAFNRLPMHVIFTAGSREDEVVREGRMVRPSLSEGLSNDVHRLFDVVGYLAKTTDEKGVTISSLLLNNQRGFRIKARLPWTSELVEYIDEPTMTKVLDELGY